MPGRKFATISLVAALVLAGMAPVSANERSQQHHSTRVVENKKTEAAQSIKEKDMQERAKTALLNSSQIDSQELQRNRGPIVSVGPQARAFQRIRDIAMAPTG